MGETECSGIPFTEFGEKSNELEEADFVKLHPYPVLVADVPFPTGVGSFQTMAVREVPKNAKRMVYPLTKSKRNVFAGMITAGRASNNDIILTDPSVSKFHAYFGVTRSTQEIWVQDAGSRFGTFVHGGKQVAEGSREPLKSGYTITLGQNTRLTLFLASDFYAAAQLMHLKGYR